MKMIIRKKKKSYETTGKLICLGIAHDVIEKTNEFYLRYENENISDVIELHFTEKEELWILNYLTNKNEKR